MQLKYVHVLSSNRWISMQKQDLNRKWILFLIKKKRGGGEGKIDMQSFVEIKHQTY